MALFVHEGDVLAVQAFCPHLEAPLFLGSVADGAVTCPWHRWRFDLRSGACLERGEGQPAEESDALAHAEVRRSARGTLVLARPDKPHSPACVRAVARVECTRTRTGERRGEDHEFDSRVDRGDAVGASEHDRQATGLRAARQVRVPQRRGLGQGSHRQAHGRGGGESRLDQAWRHVDRTHQRQHRHRHGTGRGDQGLPHDHHHAREDEPREAGRARGPGRGDHPHADGSRVGRAREPHRCRQATAGDPAQRTHPRSVLQPEQSAGRTITARDRRSSTRRTVSSTSWSPRPGPAAP